MIQKIAAGFVMVVLLSGTVLSQGNNSKIGDNYARAALRAVIYAGDGSISAEQISIAVDEADVEANTPAEEGSLHEINRIVRVWMGRPIGSEDRVCYQALKASLKARNGATPEACR